MNKRKLIELNIKLDQIWFENIMISSEVFGENRMSEYIDKQTELINEARSMVKDEIGRKFKISNGKSVDYNDLFCGKYSVDEIIDILNGLSSKDNKGLHIRLLK